MTRAFLLVLAFLLVSLTGIMQASASCSVSRNCPSHSPVSCSGNTCSSGSTGPGWVECDGVRTYCPPDCSSNGVCNPDCALGADPDCACAADGSCNLNCGISQDIDCCPEGAYCKYNRDCGPWGTCNNRACICL